MLDTRVAARAAVLVSVLSVCTYASAQTDAGRASRISAVRNLLTGSGEEFETVSWSALLADDLGTEPAVAALELTGTCCTDGDCICRGADPTDATPNRNGPFRAASYTRGFRIGLEFGGATVYYPTDAEPPLSAVIMCPGYTALQSSIAAWGPFFASHGIVLVTIDTRSTLDQVPQRAEALLDALESLKAENVRAGSPLQGKLTRDRFGLAGWSMGGGGTWLATADHPEFKSAVTLAGHNLTAGGGIISLGSLVPTLILNGANDFTILGGLGQSESAYSSIPNGTPKLLYVMAGEGHFSWGTPRTNNNAAGRYVLAWEKVYLEGDQRYKKFLLQRGPRATTWQTNVR